MLQWLKRLFKASAPDTPSPNPSDSQFVAKGKREGPLPHFTYYPDPIADGSIEEKTAICECCEMESPYICTTGIYAAEEIETICPWCVADGSAARKFDGAYQDMYNVPDTVPADIVDEISSRTPGYSTWQGNRWLFTETDAMVFVGEVDGKALLALNDPKRTAACLAAFSDWNIPNLEEELKNVVRGGQPAIYLFQDRETGRFEAYSDST